MIEMKNKNNQRGTNKKSFKKENGKLCD